MVKIRDTEVICLKGDITEVEADAIVNAANQWLKMGGGVAGAILRKGGPSIQEECDRIGYCPVGGAVITGAGKLRARYVIHAVGPRMGEGDEERKLRDAVINSLKLADTYNLTSIAMPAISTGAFGYPLEEAAKVIITAVTDYLLRENSGLKKVLFVLYDEHAFRVFQRLLEEHPIPNTRA
ncbi:Appr-1-p processing enzyme family [Candidatus Caldarchaeum subterraneum]|uniref:Appr-1-p processing domain-containing protein n=2 Tax=Thermoproteati TaxID=1783275 RepID=H5SNQ2_9CREN|nr:appr-1-p processing domain-containing protein [Candidatus Caldarchaeum subterraneum]BAJ48476.1 Appr-1-p processing enzyme family [Candidatus Caldarchaeum subterraneum]BAJ51227.1 Appr-1-p processing enzyme family [Candidatus Caldarchaeum subterraneum]BAL57788.1 appr-1-p processing domain-containing protein [uncultured crenarchaeote]